MSYIRFLFIETVTSKYRYPLTFSISLFVLPNQRINFLQDSIDVLVLALTAMAQKEDDCVELIHFLIHLFIGIKNSLRLGNLYLTGRARLGGGGLSEELG